MLTQLLAGAGLAAASLSPFDPEPVPHVHAGSSLESMVPLSLSGLPLDFQTLTVDPHPGARLNVSLYLESTEVQVALERMDMRSVSAAPRADGRAPQTFRGTLAGRPDSLVVASNRDGDFRALIQRGGDSAKWWVLPLKDLTGDQSDAGHVVARGSDLPAGAPLQCGVDDGPGLGARGDSGGGRQFSTTTYLADVFLDADYEYFTVAGSVQAAEDQMEETMLFTSAIYEWNFGLQFQIGRLVVWDDPADPFSATTGSSAAAEYRDFLAANYTCGDWDLGQVFSGRSFGNVAGYAVSVACSCGSMFFKKGSASVVTNRSTVPVRVALSAHEFGHNLDADHCNGDPDCGIMYGNISNASDNVQFGSSASAQIGAYVSTKPCFDAGGATGPPPTLTSTAPVAVEALHPAGGLANVLVRGTELDNVHLADVDGVVVDLNYITPIDDISFGLDIPRPAALGSTDIMALNEAGWSNAVALNVVATDPPRLELGSNYSFPAGIDVDGGGFPGVAAVFLIADDPATSMIGGFPVLLSPLESVTTTLDAAGLEDHNFIQGLAPGTTYYLQLLTRDSAGAFYATSVMSVLYN